MQRDGADRRARRLLRWYPKSWRLRYGEEFTQLLIDDIDDRPHSWHRTLDVARSGLAARAARKQRLQIARFSLATAVVAVALSGAAYLGSLHLDTRTYHYNCAHVVFPHGVTCGPNQRSAWQLPVAVLIAGLGAAVALGVARRSKRTVKFSLVVGAAGVLAVFAALGLVGVWHEWAALSNQCLASYVGGPPRLGQVLPAPSFSCLAITGHGYAGPWTYLAVGLGCVLAGICLFALAPGLRRALAALGGGFVRPPSRARLAAAVGILGGTLAVAAILHGLQGSPPVCPHGFVCAPRSPWSYPRHAWADPAALAVCLLGLAGAAAVLLTPRRLAAAVLVLGTSLAAAAVLLGHQTPPTQVPFAYRPAWVDPATLGVLLFGLAGAAAVVTTARRRTS
jgi:hypothetical protein